MPDYTPNQLKAIREIDKNLQIIACAGSGKTQVISARIVEILKRKKKDGVKPESIVAFTFTEKAAAELKDRIAGLCKEEFGDAIGLADMYVGTIHGFCLNLLQTYLYRFLKYTPLTDIQQRLLVDRNYVKSGMKGVTVSTSGGMRALRRYNETFVFLQALGVIREADVRPAIRRTPIWQAMTEYQALLDEHAYLDYTTMMLEAVIALAKDGDLRQKISERVKYLTVDEYQDVNPIQERLIRLLHDLGANLCVVGDDDQTLYQWRGSDVGNILTFKNRYPNVRRMRIEENFRSTGAVVDLARAVIERNNPDRLAKRMVGASHQAFEAGDIYRLEFKSPEEEAGFIADRVEALLGTAFQDTPTSERRGLTYADIAILLRSVKKSATPIVEELRTRKIPAVVVGMAGLFDTFEAQAARAIFWFMTGDCSAADLEKAWTEADVGVDRKMVRAAIRELERQKADWPNQRWGVYSLQRAFLDFLTAIGLREERVPNGRGEVVFYNLGKFSQAITDFEIIHYKSDPARKYQTFSLHLRYQAPDYYAEGLEETERANPNAVRVMTIHQAKGMEFPVVFVPCLTDKVFPPRGGGGIDIWHLVHRELVQNAGRYDGSLEDERRLFYVAVTWSKKYLFCTRSPHTTPTGKTTYTAPCPFFTEFNDATRVITIPRKDPTKRRSLPARLPSAAQNVVLSFSELKYYFNCPHEFKLRFLYGFNPPIHEALGYGKSLHDAVAEVHRRLLDGETPTKRWVPDLVETHLHVPYAYDALEEDLRDAALRTLDKYISDNRDEFRFIEHAEKPIELDLGDGIIVTGRIDLIRRADTRQVIVVDFKSTRRSQTEDVTAEQLRIYALGYTQLTGEKPDFLEVYTLDEGQRKKDPVDEVLLGQTRTRVAEAGQRVREGVLDKPTKCQGCDLRGICRTNLEKLDAKAG